MIGRVLKRGSRVAGLLYYLYGPGKARAHSNPHLVSSWRHPFSRTGGSSSDGCRQPDTRCGLECGRALPGP